MFEVINVNLQDQRELKARLKKIKEVAPFAEVKFDEKVSRYYICLGEYADMKTAEQKAKEFRRKRLLAGVKID